MSYDFACRRSRSGPTFVFQIKPKTWISVPRLLDSNLMLTISADPIEIHRVARYLGGQLTGATNERSPIGFDRNPLHASASMLPRRFKIGSDLRSHCSGEFCRRNLAVERSASESLKTAVSKASMAPFRGRAAEGKPLMSTEIKFPRRRIPPISGAIDHRSEIADHSAA